MLPWKLSHFSEKKIWPVLENNWQGAVCCRVLFIYLFIVKCWIFKMSTISVGLPALSSVWYLYPVELRFFALGFQDFFLLILIKGA